MKLLILSDSHGSLEQMELAVQKENPNVVVHLGDYWRDAEPLSREFPALRIVQVAGNCDHYDWHPDMTEEIICPFEGVVFYITHGHLHHVKMSLLRLRLAAQEAGAKIALFGHTHCAFAGEADGVIMLNPGTCRGISGTYGIIELIDGAVQYEIRTFRELLRGGYQ